MRKHQFSTSTDNSVLYHPSQDLTIHSKKAQTEKVGYYYDISLIFITRAFTVISAHLSLISTHLVIWTSIMSVRQEKYVVYSILEGLYGKI